MLARIVLRTFLFGVIPSWILMRAGAAGSETRSSRQDPGLGRRRLPRLRAGALLLIIVGSSRGCPPQAGRRAGGSGRPGPGEHLPGRSRRCVVRDVGEALVTKALPLYRLRFHAAGTVGPMSVPPSALLQTPGFLVADSTAPWGASMRRCTAAAGRSRTRSRSKGFFAGAAPRPCRRRRPDRRPHGVVGLSVRRQSLRSFLHQRPRLAVSQQLAVGRSVRFRRAAAVVMPDHLVADRANRW